MSARIDRWADADAPWMTQRARAIVATCARHPLETVGVIGAGAIAGRVEPAVGASLSITAAAVITSAAWPRLRNVALRWTTEPLAEWWERICDEAHTPFVPQIIGADHERTRLQIRSVVGQPSLDSFARSARNLGANLGTNVTVWIRDDHPGEGIVYIGRQPSPLEQITDWRYPTDVVSLATRRIVIGRSERGLLSLPLDGHWLIAGRSGSGKTELVRTVLSAVAADPHARLAVSNLKGDLGDWREHANWWSRSPADVTTMMQTLIAEAHRRSDHLDATGAKEISPSAEWPLIVCVLDEVPRWLSAERDAAKMLDEAAATWRALGMRLVLTAQHPTVKQFGGESSIRANLATVICLRVRDADASKAALGVERDVADASELPGPGWCYVAADSAPFLARTFLAAPTPQPKPKACPWPAPSGAPVEHRHADTMSASNALLQGDEADEEDDPMSDVGADVESPYGWFAPSDVPAPAQAPVEPVKLTDADRKIIDALTAAKALTIAELTRLTGVTDRQISRRLDILAPAGIVTRRPDKRWELA